MATTATTPRMWNGGRSPFNVEYGKLMMWYFLMSDAFTFGAFLISYGTTRFATNGWPNPNEVFDAVPFLGQRLSVGVCKFYDVCSYHQFCNNGTCRT